MEINVLELFLDVSQGFVVAAQRVNHLVGVVERDNFRARTGSVCGNSVGGWLPFPVLSRPFKDSLIVLALGPFLLRLVVLTPSIRHSWPL